MSRSRRLSLVSSAVWDQYRHSCRHSHSHSHSGPAVCAALLYTVFTVERLVHCPVQCTVYSLKITVYSAQFIEYIVQCTATSVQCGAVHTAAALSTQSTGQQQCGAESLAGVWSVECASGGVWSVRCTWSHDCHGGEGKTAGQG